MGQRYFQSHGLNRELLGSEMKPVEMPKNKQTKKHHSQPEEFTSLVCEINVVVEQIVVLFKVASDALKNMQIPKQMSRETNPDHKDHLCQCSNMP